MAIYHASMKIIGRQVKKGGKVVPGPDDTVIIQKLDVATFDRNDDGKISCKKLLIDPKGTLAFKTGAGKQICCIADAIESFGAIKLDGTKSANDYLELRMVGDTLTFFYNCQPAGSVRDATPATGRISFNSPIGVLLKKVEWCDFDEKPVPPGR